MVRCKVSVTVRSERGLSTRTWRNSIRSKYSPKDLIFKPSATGILILQAETTQFRVDRAVLARFSPVFYQAMTKIPPLIPRNALPVLKVEDSAETMRIFLSFLLKNNYTPRSVDEIIIALHLSKQYQLPKHNPIQARIFHFLYDIYPTTLYKLDKLQTIDPHLRDFYWLQSEACFRLANTVYRLRQEQGATFMLNVLLFTILLCCAKRPLHDINKGVLDLDRRRWFNLENDLRLCIILLMRPKIDELAHSKTYAFLWRDEWAPAMNDDHKDCTRCQHLPELGSSILCNTHRDCETYRKLLEDEVAIFLDPETGYDNALWHFPSLVEGKPIKGVNCCESCRENWVYSISESRGLAVDELMDVYVDAWKARYV